MNHSLHTPEVFPAMTAWPTPPQHLADRMITEAHSRYALARSTYMAVGSPAVIFVVRTESEVQEAIRYAALVREHTGIRVPFSVRSGGHGIAGTATNTGGIILDLSLLNQVEILDPELGLVRIGAGATWGQVSGQLAREDLVLSSGNFGDTGVGGLATAGGIGYFARAQGLTLDSMVRARLVTADGSIRWVDDTHEPDLFWAVRGGGTQVGVVTEFEFMATSLRTATGDAQLIHQQVTYLSDSLADFTQAWGQWVREAPNELESFLMLQSMGDGQYAIQARNVWAGDDQEAAGTTLSQAENLARVYEINTERVSYPLIVPTPNSPHMGQQRIKMRDVLVDRADAQLGEAMSHSLAQRPTLVGELRALGGAVSRVAAEATAWGSRHQEVLAATWLHPVSVVEQDQSFAPLQQLGSGTYGAYSSDTRASAAALAWPGATGKRLTELAVTHDPSHLFDGGLNLRSA